MPLSSNACVADQCFQIKGGGNVPVCDIIVPVCCAVVPKIASVSEASNARGRGYCAVVKVASSSWSGHATV